MDTQEMKEMEKQLKEAKKAKKAARKWYQKKRFLIPMGIILIFIIIPNNDEGQAPNEESKQQQEQKVIEKEESEKPELTQEQKDELKRQEVISKVEEKWKGFGIIEGDESSTTSWTEIVTEYKIEVDLENKTINYHFNTNTSDNELAENLGTLLVNQNYNKDLKNYSVTTEDGEVFENYKVTVLSKDNKELFTYDYKEAAAYQEWITSQFSVWDGSHRELVSLVKDNMNDPKSFEHVETKYLVLQTQEQVDTVGQGKIGDLYIYMKFRGANAFGAIILSEVEALAEYDTNMIYILTDSF